MHRPSAKARDIAERFRAQGGKRALFAKSADRGSLYVYEVIGEDWWTGGGVTAKKVADALDAMAGVKVLDIFINSEGGDVFEAKAIHTNLRRFEGEKVVHIDGIAASAATLIAMAGDRIITEPVATWMVHEAWSVALGRADDMRATADLLDMQNRDLAETYAKRTGKSVDAMLQVMAAETWMNAQQALDAGFTDEVAAEPCTCTESCSCCSAGTCGTDCKCAADCSCCAGGDCPDKPAAATKASNLVAGIESTQARIRGLTAGQKLVARATELSKPGQPGAKRPASR